MYKLSIDLDRKLEIMKKHSLSAEEWLMVELLWTANDGRPDQLYKYFNECKKESMPRDILQALKDKKVFASSYKLPKAGEQFEYDQVEFSKTFINDYFKLGFEAGSELWDAYPEYIQNTSGKLYVARSFTNKGFIDDEALFAKYLKNIQYKVENHNQVMDILAWAKEHGLLTYGIVEYIVARKWNDHIKLREDGKIENYAFKVDTMEEL